MRLREKEEAVFQRESVRTLYVTREEDEQYEKLVDLNKVVPLFIGFHSYESYQPMWVV